LLTPERFFARSSIAPFRGTDAPLILCALSSHRKIILKVVMSVAAMKVPKHIETLSGTFDDLESFIAAFDDVEQSVHQRP
jgi:hypothetical protein